MDLHDIAAFICLCLFWCALVCAFVCAIIFGSRRNDRVDKWYNSLDEHDKAVINDWKEVNKLLTKDMRKKHEDK